MTQQQQQERRTEYKSLVAFGKTTYDDFNLNGKNKESKTSDR